MVVTFFVTLGTSSTQLGSKVSWSDATRSCRQVFIQADAGNASDCYVGDATVSDTNGMVIPAPVDSVVSAPLVLGTGDAGFHLTLNDLYVDGAENDVVRVLAVLS